MKIVVKRVGEVGKIVQVENTLKTFQDIVGGYIQTYPLGANMLIICNEEGIPMGLEPNLKLVLKNGYIETIVGDIAIVSQGEDDFESLTDHQIELLKHFKIIE